jgi:EAL domain-containing protein (putative c-di-GMP-specific phosphodiesterase class I)
VLVEVARRIVNSVRARVRLFPKGRENLLETVKESPEDSGIDRNFLEVELPESLLLQPTGATMKLLHDLRRLGVRVAVDETVAQGVEQAASVQAPRDIGADCLQCCYFGGAVAACDLRLRSESDQAA